MHVDHAQNASSYEWHFTIQISLKDSETIHSVQLILILDYKLHVYKLLNVHEVLYNLHVT